MILRYLYLIFNSKYFQVLFLSEIGLELRRLIGVTKGITMVMTAIGISDIFS